MSHLIVSTTSLRSCNPLGSTDELNNILVIVSLKNEHRGVAGTVKVTYSQVCGPMRGWSR
jgi:hypothetical protein